jgi:hypothetical protein
MAIKLLFHSATFTGSPRSLMVASRTSMLAIIRLDHPRRPCALWLRNRRAAVGDVTTETLRPTCRPIGIRMGGLTSSPGLFRIAGNKVPQDVI